MVILITGASHTGKTCLAQKMLERYKYPYLSIDHLKMGLIRSGNTNLNALSRDEDLTDYLWPIVREMIKTAIENGQNLIVEGCYIPLDWKKDFSEEYLGEIKCYVLVMTEDYIRNHFKDIKRYENVIENRITDDISMEELITDNKKVLKEARRFGQECIVIDREYEISI